MTWRSLSYAKVQIKSEKLTPFGGIFQIIGQFNILLVETIDSTLGLRCTSYGYQYNEILHDVCQDICPIYLNIMKSPLNDNCCGFKDKKFAFWEKGENSTCYHKTNYLLYLDLDIT